MTFDHGTPGKRWLAIAALAGCFYTGSSWADIMVRVEESFNGQLPVTALHWFGTDRSTRDDGNRYVVTRLDQGHVLTIDRLTQSYQTTPLPTAASENKLPEVRAFKRDETRKIGQWSAQKYEIIGAATAGMRIVIWATNDLDIDLKNFHRVMAGLARRPGSEWMAAYREIEGFPVLQEVEMNHKGTVFYGQTRVVAVEERVPPANIYAPPDDYEEVSKTSP